MVFLTTIKSLALGIWLGALIMLGYAVAAPLFRNLPSKTLAGHVNAVILGRMNDIEWVCGIIALLASALLLFMNWSDASRPFRIGETLTVLIAVLLLFVYSKSTASRMDELRATIKDFDSPQQTTEYVTAKKEFDALHKRYSTLVGINLLLIATSFVIGSIVKSKQ